MNFHMTRMAQRHEVGVSVRATVRQGKDVMHFHGGRQSAGLTAFLTQRVRLHVPVADALPASPIALVAGRVALVPIVLFIRLAPVLGAVQPVSQPWTTGVLAWALWFHWH